MLHDIYSVCVIGLVRSSCDCLFNNVLYLSVACCGVVYVVVLWSIVVHGVAGCCCV